MKARKLKPNKPGEGCPVLEYAERVVSGRRLASKFVNIICQRHIDDIKTGHSRGLWWDREAAGYAIEFCESQKHHKGRWAGQNIKLSDWQRFIVGCVFGWKIYSPDLKRWKRRYENCWVEVPRKNGKSTLAAAIALYLLCADGEGGPEVVTLATKRDQAKIVFNDACQMARANQTLSADLKILKDQILVRGSSGVLKPLSSDSKRADGLNPSGAICDEIHKWPSSDLWDVIQTGLGARDEPVIFAITTAGSYEESIYGILRDHAEETLKGLIDDPSFFAYIATADEGDDWQDPKTWEKANPNWGVSVSEPSFRKDLSLLRGTASRENRFKRDRLDIRTSSDSTWIDDFTWMTGAEPDFSEEDLYGLPCMAGLDMANSNDTASLVLVFPDGFRSGNPAYKVLPFFWIPKNAKSEEGDKLRQKLKGFVEKGKIFETDGNTIDQNTIKSFILKCREKFHLQKLFVDPWETAKLSQELIEEGMKVESYEQSVKNYNEPAKELEAAISSGRMRHAGNPVLRWMISVCVIYQDGEGRMKPTRKRSKGKIDGIMALLMGLGGLIREREEPEPDIYWVDEGD